MRDAAERCLHDVLDAWAERQPDVEFAVHGVRRLTYREARAATLRIANALVGAGVDPVAVSPAELARLVDARDRIPRQAFDEAISKLGEPGFSADPYLAQEAVSDTSELEPVVERILAANPGQVDAYRGGKEGLLGFFVGQVMKETKGKANPRVVNDLVREKLSA